MAGEAHRLHEDRGDDHLGPGLFGVHRQGRGAPFLEEIAELRTRLDLAVAPNRSMSSRRIRPNCSRASRRSKSLYAIRRV